MEKPNIQQMLATEFFELYKDTYGYKPRHINIQDMSVEELKKQIADLDVYRETDSFKERMADEEAEVDYYNMLDDYEEQDYLKYPEDGSSQEDFFDTMNYDSEKSKLKNFTVRESIQEQGSFFDDDDDDSQYDEPFDWEEDESYLDEPIVISQRLQNIRDKEEEEEWHCLDTECEGRMDDPMYFEGRNKLNKQQLKRLVRESVRKQLVEQVKSSFLVAEEDPGILIDEVTEGLAEVSYQLSEQIKTLTSKLDYISSMKRALDSTEFGGTIEYGPGISNPHGILETGAKNLRRLFMTYGQDELSDKINELLELTL